MATSLRHVGTLAITFSLLSLALTAPPQQYGKHRRWPSSTPLPSTNSTPPPPMSTSSSPSPSYDFIIVGGGTAGLALANRLTESGDQNVLVLEAGEAPTTVASYEAPGANQLILGSSLDWAFTSLPEESLNGRQLTYNRGRCLGGSSAINGLTYGRGSSSIYDLWQSLGNPGWSWEDVFPLFIKSTHFNPPTDNVKYQGYDPSGYGDGPVQVGYPGNYYSAPGSSAFIESLGAIGVEPTNDLNTGNNVGAKQETLTLDTEYHRSSAYDNYYIQAMDRPNLRVLTGAPVQRIILKEEGSAVYATGVIYTDYASGATINATCSKEVIMSAGSFQTPQLLLLSGIGPPATLAANGIQMYIDNENVGKNLQDHSYFSLNVRTEADVSYSSLYSDISRMQAAEMEYQESQGPFIAPIGPSFGFEKLNASTLAQLDPANSLADRQNQSHIEYYYETTFYPNRPTPQYVPLSNESYVSFTAGVLAPSSRGYVSIESSSTSDPPQINLNYFSSPTDQALGIYAFKNLRKVLGRYAASFGNTIGPNNGEVSPGPSVESDADILEYIRNTAVTVWHASGTCAMLPQGSGGVVDARLRVYGVSGLRVVDTSIFPIVPDHHTQGPVYMVAEKAAQLIKEDYGFGGR
ncbi:MAG: hypothetical protein M1837_003766 [Sclerophora amabilis]|nr:MAG: hypothetical protein M1837_003766 [Sclerophora amabilis]